MVYRYEVLISNVCTYKDHIMTFTVVDHIQQVISSLQCLQRRLILCRSQRLSMWCKTHWRIKHCCAIGKLSAVALTIQAKLVKTCKTLIWLFRIVFYNCVIWSALWQDTESRGGAAAAQDALCSCGGGQKEIFPLQESTLKHIFNNKTFAEKVSLGTLR